MIAIRKMTISFRLYILIFFCLIQNISVAQETKISGQVTNINGQPLFGASVILPETNEGAVTGNDGIYELSIAARKDIIIQCSYLGYKTVTDTINLNDGISLLYNFILNELASELESVVVTGTQQRDNTLTRINMKSIDQIPNSSGNIETLIKSMSGVVSGNELSSQYSVRGGNFDENLVYVNDIEIYRPLLVQSATQEGLSFINPNMVSSIQFSAGAFDAEYGDKMASVLDVKYKNPTEFEASAIAGLLGASVHFAGADKKNRFNFNTGFRYKTTNYLLNSLDIEGEYTPRFADFQTLFGYNITPKSSISILGNYSTNRFNLVPQNRDTEFGTLQETYNFRVFYEGQERDRFDSYMGAISYNYRHGRNLSLKFIASAFDTDEEISFDILSEYWINQVTTDTAINIGTGASLEHARNKLKGNVYSIENKGLYIHNNSTWKWGLKLQYETIDDRISEWQMLDSAGMSIPYSDEFIYLDYSYKAHNTIESFRYQAFTQNTTSFYTNTAEIGLTVGLRLNYWDYNNEFLVSPRASISISPYWNKKVNFYLAAGAYNQPPFYKELKQYNGELFENKKAQKSYQFVFGTDIYYQAWGRPFVFTSEIYYKNLYKLTPYRVENVQVKYLPEYNARGYATGIDFRVNGEFVQGVESWFSLSLLRTRENSYNDNYVLNDGTVIYPGYYRRPSDQTLTFAIFFQDYLPSNPNYKVHLLVNYGTGLPYSGPRPERPSETFLLSQYRRVDIGFSRIIRENKTKKVGFHDIWITLEILNLLDAPNMASYDWIKTVENNEGYNDSYAVPNYLTGRRLNFKISTKL
jgi:hypothetical protein